MGVLVSYFSKSGNTEKLAKFIVDGLRDEGVQVEVKKVGDTSVDDLLAADAIILGTPVYYGTMAAEVKDLIDRSVKLHGKLDGKIGGAFCTSNNVAGGNETAVLDIINALLVHGMVVQGDPKGNHYGPIALGAPDENEAKMARRWGQRWARLVKEMK